MLSLFDLTEAADNFLDTANCLFWAQRIFDHSIFNWIFEDKIAYV